MKDLVLDLYRLRYAERLALKDIPETRLAAYRYLFDRARISPLRSAEVEIVNGLGTLFLAFLNGEPCQNFVIDLEKMQSQAINFLKCTISLLVCIIFLFRLGVSPYFCLK